VVVTEGFLERLFKSIDDNPKMEVEVDLLNQKVTNLATGESESFEINGYKKHCLVNGLDDIDFLLHNTDKIVAWEQMNK
jgi:3-isopropylmalate/(R)-2-methylmalate dehydratase small subunit